MRRIVGLLATLLLTLSLTGQVYAQAKKEKKSSKEERISGRVHMVNKDTSTITVRTGGNVQRQVVYSADTKFTYRNQAGSMDDVKDGRRVICIGKFDEKTRLMASRVDVREGR